MRVAISGLLLVGALCGACGDDDDDDKNDDGSGGFFEYDIEPKSGNTELSGTVLVVDKSGKVTITVKLEGALAGEHGLHLHETSDCSADDAMSAGGHWNPDMHMHGEPKAESHLGDLGNITVGADGKGTLTISKSEWTFGDGAATDVLETALVVHAMPDDFTTQPTGASGARIGCTELEDF